MNVHFYSGWPGAFCRKCGQDDPAENAITDPDVALDYSTGRFVFATSEAEATFNEALCCPVADDPEKHPWVKARQEREARYET